MDDLTVLGATGLAGLGLVLALVEAGKRIWKWDQQQSAVAALVVGQGLALGTYLSARYPEFAGPWGAVVTGLVLSLTAMGLYSGSKALASK